MKIISVSKILFFFEKSWSSITMIMIMSMFYGIYYSLVISPADYQQGEAVRIMYIHVPSAWMSLIIYSIMAFFSAIYLIWHNQIANMISKSSANIGASFAFITLITGAIWGKPIWGTWWVWDARLTSMLILFFFYLSYILLVNGLEDRPLSKAPAILSIVGFINVPIVKFSVEYWNSLHQPASIFRIGGPSIDSSMLIPLVIMITACMLYYISLLILKLRITILNQKIYHMQLKNIRI